MKRWIWASLTAALMGALADSGRADENSLPNYEGRLLRRHEEQARKNRADQLRFERARIRARRRMAMEAQYERAGYPPIPPSAR